MLAMVFVVALVLLAVVLGLAATKSDTFSVVRATSMKAPPEKILPHIADFQAWRAWSPWERLDPALKRSYSGAPSGKGAVYEWEGNSKAGRGRMEITDVAPGMIVIKLDFLKPFEAHNTAEFTLEPRGDSTNVIWNMHGPSPFVIKVMGVFMNMDRMVGRDFERGLADLKAVAER